MSWSRNIVYLRFVRRQPCANCGHPPPVEAHHIIGYRRGGIRAPDLMAVPLCRACHRELHRTLHEDRLGWLMAQVRWLDQTIRAAERECIL